MRRQVAMWILCLVTVLILSFASRVGAEQLGVTLPAPIAVTLTQGGPPNFADTFVTPYVATGSRVIVTWKAQFVGGRLQNGMPGISVLGAERIERLARTT